MLRYHEYTNGSVTVLTEERQSGKMWVPVRFICIYGSGVARGSAGAWPYKPAPVGTATTEAAFLDAWDLAE
jgi:hypothetical protein